MKQALLALIAGGLLISAGVLFERNRLEDNRYRHYTTSELLRLVRSNSSDGLACLELARRMRGENRLPDALKHVKQAQKLAPGSTEAFYLEGLILRIMGRKDDARSPLQRAVELDPRFAPAHLELGLAYNAMGHLKQAIDELRQYVDLEPNDDYGFYWLGACAMSAGMFDVSERSLQKAKSLDPERAITYIALGNLRLHQTPGSRELEQALESYRRAAALDPTDPQPVEMTATVYYRQHRFAEAAREFERALQIDPQVAEVYYPLGLAYAKIGEEAKSKRCLQIAKVYAAGKEAFVRPGGAASDVEPKR